MNRQSLQFLGLLSTVFTIFFSTYLQGGISIKNGIYSVKYTFAYYKGTDKVM
jgi:hypothetical protein